MSDHTPGPWEHEFDHDEYGDPEYNIWHGDEIVGYAVEMSKAAGDFEANARLIAAAPTLYEIVSSLNRGHYRLGLAKDYAR